MNYQYVWQFVKKQLFRSYLVLLTFITLKLNIIFFLAKLLNAILHCHIFLVLRNRQCQIHNRVEFVLSIPTFPTNQHTLYLALKKVNNNRLIKFQIVLPFFDTLFLQLLLLFIVFLIIQFQTLLQFLVIVLFGSIKLFMNNIQQINQKLLSIFLSPFSELTVLPFQTVYDFQRFQYFERRGPHFFDEISETSCQ